MLASYNGVVLPLLLLLVLMTGSSWVSLVEAQKDVRTTVHSIVHPREENFSRFVYSLNQVVVIEDALKDKPILHCEVIYVPNPADVDEVIRRSNSSAVVFKHSTFSLMIDRIYRCADVIDDLVDRKYVFHSTNQRLNTSSARLFPGTKWCGNKDIATDYHDLGEYGMEDRCCRAYHMCSKLARVPNRITMNMKYISNCLRCSGKFRECLEKRDTKISVQLLGVYNKLWDSKCLETTN